MAILRTIVCDTCGDIAAEAAPNEGWANWGALHGIQLNGTQHPQLCPKCLGKVAEFIDKEMRYGMD